MRQDNIFNIIKKEVTKKDITIQRPDDIDQDEWDSLSRESREFIFEITEHNKNLDRSFKHVKI